MQALVGTLPYNHSTVLLRAMHWFTALLGDPPLELDAVCSDGNEAMLGLLSALDKRLLGTQRKACVLRGWTTAHVTVACA